MKLAYAIFAVAMAVPTMSLTFEERLGLMQAKVLRESNADKALLVEATAKSRGHLDVDSIDKLDMIRAEFVAGGSTYGIMEDSLPGRYRHAERLNELYNGNFSKNLIKLPMRQHALSAEEAEAEVKKKIKGDDYDLSVLALKRVDGKISYVFHMSDGTEVVVEAKRGGEVKVL